MDETEEFVDDFLAHFGVKGMKWGVRQNSGVPGVSAKTNRDARRDAREFTKAKMYYGEGAGNRRKLIKATVETKSKNPAYKKAFDHHVSNTDMSTRANQAKNLRKRKDTSNFVRKTGRGAVHIINGNSRYASAAASLIVGGYLYARKTGIDKTIYNSAKKTISEAANYVKNR